jgi:hypothetical protein
MHDQGEVKARKGELPLNPGTGRVWRPGHAYTRLVVPKVPPIGISDTKKSPIVHIAVLEYAPFEGKITDNTKHKKIAQFWHLRCHKYIV